MKLCCFVCLIVLLNGFVLVRLETAVRDDMIEGENRRLGVTVKKSLSERKRETTDGFENIDSELEAFDGGGGVKVEGVVESEEVPVEDLISKQKSLFRPDAVNSQQLNQIDCHLRNMDYCFAGLLANSARMLPENDDEFETRCDELKAASSCLAVYNQRCQTMKIFSILGPMMGNSDEANDLLPEEILDIPMAPAGEQILLNKDDNSSKNNDIEIKNSDLMNICQPSAKRTKANRILRQRLFSISKCINQRIPSLSPCIEDLKTALQLIYEPTRSLPLRPTCCAITRFRNCSMDALDGVCGLNSFKEFERSLSSFNSGNMLKSLDRVCKQSSKLNDSGFCSEVLPPSGMKIYQRTGRKASKLARALNLFQFSPAANSQEAKSS